MFNPSPPPAWSHFHKSAFCEERLKRSVDLYVPARHRGAAAAHEANSLLESEVRGGNQRTEGVMGAIMALLTPPFKVPQAQALVDRKYNRKTAQVSGQHVKHQKKKVHSPVY